MATARKTAATKKGATTPRRKGATPAPTKRTTAKSAARPRPAGGVTSAKAWKSSARVPVELELPSGNVCLALNRGMQAFLDEGTVPNSLMPIVQAAISGAEKGKKPQELFGDAADDPNMIRDMLTMCDGVILACVQQPEILPVPMADIPDGVDHEGEPKTRRVVVEAGQSFTLSDGTVVERDPDLLYVDEVDLEDKLFVFQWAVGGTTNIESFRQEFVTAMEDISDGEGVA